MKNLYKKFSCEFKNESECDEEINEAGFDLEDEEEN